MSCSREFTNPFIGRNVYHSFADDEHSYVPYTEEKGDITSCGIPQNYNASKEFANKKVVLFAVPGTCSLPVPSVSPHLPLSVRT